MADLDFNIKGNNEKFIKEIEQIRSSIKSITIELKDASNESNGFTNVLKKTFDMLGGKEALKEFVSDVVRVRGEYQQLELSFSTLLQNKGEADNLMSQMMQSAAETPFSLTELAAEAKQLIGYGVASEEVNDTLLRLGEIASGVGAPLEQITSLYGTVMTQGGLYAEDLTKFSASGVPILQGLADILGVNTEKVNEMVAAGTIGFPEVQKVIENLTNEGGRFYGSMVEQSRTIVGEINNLRDAWDIMLNGIGESQEGMISGAIGGITYLVENYEQIGKILLALIETYGVYKAACIANIVFTQSLATTQMELGLVLVKLKKDFITLTGSMNLNPWVLAATAIIGLGLAMWNLADRTTAAEKAQKRFNDEQEKFNQQQEKRKQKIENLVRVIKDETETKQAKIIAYEELQRYSPALTKAYSMEEIANLDLAEAQRISNKERDEMDYDHVVSRINEITGALKQLKAEDGKLVVVRTSVITIDNSAAIRRHEQDLKNYKKRLDEYNRLKKEAEENSKPIEDRILVAKNNLEEIREEYNKVNTLMIEERAKLDKNPFYIIPLRLQLQFDGLGESLDEAESKVLNLENQKAGKTTYQGNLRKARESWLETKGEYERVSKSLTSTPQEVDTAKDKMNAAKKTYEDLGGVTDNRYEEKARKIREQQKRLEELRNKQTEDDIRTVEELENKKAQAEVAVMKEGNAKTLAQMQFDHKMQMQQLEREKEEFLQKKINNAKAIFDAEENVKAAKDPNYKKETFDTSKISFSQTEKDAFGQQKMYLELRQISEMQAFLNGNLEKKAWNSYLEEYGSFQEKKQAITEDYNTRIREAATKGEKASLEKEKESKLKGVNFEELKASINFADIFGDLNIQSTDALSKMRDNLKELINKSAKDLNPADLKALQDAFKDIEIKVSERNPFGELKRGINDYKDATADVIKAQEDLNTVQQGGEVIIGTYIDKQGRIVKDLLTQEQAEKNLSEAQKERLGSQGKLTKAVNSMGEKGQQVVNAGNDMVNMLTDLGVEVPDSIVGALNGMGQVMSSLSSIDLTKPFSILTGITGVMSGIVQTITSFFGASDGTAYYEGVKAELEAVNEIYNSIIANSKEDIVFGGGFSSVEAATLALSNYEKKVRNLQQIADASGRAGASWKSHSAEWHSNKNVGTGNFGQMSQLIGKSVQSMDDMYYLTGDELYLIQSQMPEAWGKIDARIRENLDNIIACKDEANELRDALNQAMTGVDQDSFYNEFINGLSDMDTSFEDMCGNFEAYLRKSIMAGLIASQYKGRIDGLYQQWSNYAQSDKKITEGEADNLRKEYQQIIEDMMTDRDEMARSFGWDISSSSSSQESSAKGFSAMSQDTGDELNGRFTALQISNEEIKNSMLFVLGSLSSLCTTASDGNILLMEMRNLAIMSNGHLEDIAKYTKIMLGFGEKLDNIDRNTQKI